MLSYLIENNHQEKRKFHSMKDADADADAVRPSMRSQLSS